VATTPVDNTAPVDSGRRGFNWGLLGLLGLAGLFRGRSTEVRRETYATTSGARTVGTGTAYDDRTGTAVPRAASGTSTTGGTSGSGSSGTSGTMGDPGRR
jgi:MYXO-CTERM domain-containing protein